MTNQDIEHLRLLAVFHYVLAAMIAFFSLFPLLHMAMGIAIVSGAMDDVAHGNPPPEILGWLFIVFPALIILVGETMALCLAITGNRLSRHRNYTFCLVVAAIECMFMPLGTVLGVFTIIVLMRPTVKDLFDVSPKSR